MKLNIYAIKDNVQGAFMNPFYLQNDAVAIREFSNCIKYGPAENSLVRNAGDMALYKLGEFIEETGEITSEINFLANGGEYKVKREEKEKEKETEE